MKIIAENHLQYPVLAEPGDTISVIDNRGGQEVELTWPQGLLRTILLLFAAAAIAANCADLPSAEPAPPPIVFQADQAGNIVLSTSTGRTWKQSLVIASSEQNTIEWIEAEHSAGADGAIYRYRVQVVPYGEPTPAPPLPPEDLPLAALRAITPKGLPADEAHKLAAVYEALAAQIDQHNITSPAQLALANEVQHLATLDGARLKAWQSWWTPIYGWIDAQQTAGKLTAEKMPQYALVWRTLAEILRGAAAAKSDRSDRSDRSVLDLFKNAAIPVAKKDGDCPDGKCSLPPASQSPPRRVRGR